MATTVAEILSSPPGVTLAPLPPTATVRDALLGIFTERDYARKLALQGLSSAETMLVNVMTARLYVVSPRQTVQECLGIITKGRLRHLPVVDGGELVGLVSIGDLVNAQLEEQRFIISQMENYIVGNMGDSQF